MVFQILSTPLGQQSCKYIKPFLQHLLLRMLVYSEKDKRMISVWPLAFSSISFTFTPGYYYFCTIFHSVCEASWVLIVIKHHHFIIFLSIDIHVFIHFSLVIKTMLNIKHDMDSVCCEKRSIKH